MLVLCRDFFSLIRAGVQGSRDAVLDYRERHGLSESLEVTWHDLTSDPAAGELTRGVWWTKRGAVAPSAEPTLYARGAVKLPPSARPA